MAAGQAAIPFDHPFQVTSPSELVATVVARCDDCAWDVAGREAVTLRLAMDGRYVAHVPLTRKGRSEYPVLVGPAGAGDHVLSVQIDEELTAASLRGRGAAHVEHVAISATAADAHGYAPLSFAPILYARPNTIGRFTDVPVFMWYEVEPTPRGVRYRYSVIFTNEDGGTPTDRLMATWGRTTDIEYVYSVEVDSAGRVLADDLQGPRHEILRFGGKREGRHPLLWVTTDNNMVEDRGSTAVRYAPAPVAFPLDGVSREAVMDANPWLYELASQELVREGKIAADAPPGRGVIPDPRRFVYIEACAEVGEAALGFEVRARNAWQRSDRGVPEYKILRDGCFRAAVPIQGEPGDVTAVRVTADARPSKAGAAPPGRPPEVRVDRINTIFMLDGRYRPGPAMFRWTGPATVRVGAPLELPLSSP